MITVTMRTLTVKFPILPMKFHLTCQWDGNGADFPLFLNLIWVKLLIATKIQAFTVDISEV